MPTFVLRTEVVVDLAGERKLGDALRPFSAYLLDGIASSGGRGSSMEVFYPHTVNQQTLLENLRAALSSYQPVKEEPQSVVE
ncbi:MAG: hypothetical protein HZA34_04595 [Candidatus Pacebacteria bacterium]|nr:hypothetical protein [Candidatus Paceibacterota bacterium]